MFISVLFYLGQEDINNLDMGGDTDIDGWDSADFFGV
jgi:hypothetical protein